MPQQAKNKQDFLIEIYTEELPAKILSRLGENLLTEIKIRLDKLALSYDHAKFFATPRRLAVLVKKLVAKQTDSFVERKGPALEAAYDQTGQPTPACVGFAKSCGTTPEQLTTIKNSQGTWVSYQQKVIGKPIQEILPTLTQQAIDALALPKRMRWGSNTVEFSRPVHSVIMLYGEEIIATEILGCQTQRLTRGHRFHSKNEISISKPASYSKTLARKKVIADFAERKEMIRSEALRVISVHPDARVVMEENLLDEITGLVEWPIAICGSFDEKFLTIPAEVLIAAMQDHQRYFPVVDQENKLLPYFVAIINVESNDIARVIAGNERVLRARLADAAFFFATDKKQILKARTEKLKHIVFQAKLGTLYDKSYRVMFLTKKIAEQLNIDIQQAEAVAWLAKADLTTQMVGEFPELQGIMGYYYALHDGESQEIALAINEQYLPRFSGDKLPTTLLGCVLALADRIDTVVGIFGIQQIPSGDKDPFALRRAALGILRILIEKKLNLDLHSLISFAYTCYDEKKLANQQTVAQVWQFILDRLKPWYQDQGITADVFSSVTALNVFSLYDIHLRLQAVQNFKNLPAAESLSIANKRVSNILAKTDNAISAQKINEKLFAHDAERVLAQKLMAKKQIIDSLAAQKNYQEILMQLVSLREPVDDFFAHVLVMSEDKLQRENRVLILKHLRELFLNVADIALLQ